MSVLLEYEKNIVLDVNEDSCMFVCAEGLDLDTIIYTLIKLHNDPHNLVLISNYSLPEAKFITARLTLENEAYTPFIITAEVSAKERLEAYRRGGVVFVSSRILVVDLLRGTMPVELVTGVIVLRAHTLHESSQEAFMLRLLREKNPDVFIKAFTDNAIALMTGYNRVEHLMNQFGVSKLLLWPRFNIDVMNTLTDSPINVEELQVFLTAESVNCQRCLLEMIKATLRELVDINPILNNDEFALESALTSSFHQLTSLYIDPIWHQLTQTSHRLLADVAGLRRLLFQLIDQDAVSFLDSFEEMRQTELASLRMSRSTKVSSVQQGTYCVEIPPKLGAIYSALEEICSKLSETDRQQKCPVLILLRHSRSIEIVHYFLQNGDKKLSDWLIQGRVAYEHPVETPLEDDDSSPKKRQRQRIPEPSLPSYARRNKGAPKGTISCGMAPIVMKEKGGVLAEVKTSEEKPSVSCQETKKIVVEPETPTETLIPDLPPGCISVTFKPSEGNELKVILRVPPPGCGEEGAPSSLDTKSLDGPAGRLGGVLTRLRPQCVIFFEPRVAWVREVEVYAAKEARRRAAEGLPLDPVNVFFMVYKDSVEEQRYLTRLRREKEAFESLISLRGSIVIKKTEPVIPVAEGKEVPTVFVDVREFRSELPALLHRKGLKVNPITLTIGDYILAPHICVERKSVSDLIGSLNSGRLYQQCTSMSRHYIHPVLLIEFSMPANGITCKAPRFPNSTSSSAGASFALFTGRNAVVSADSRTDLDPHHLLPRLVLLILHFPLLRVLWSVTPYCTAELFAELKVGRAEPTLEQLPQDSDGLGEENAEAVEMLLRLPGISWRNYRRVMARVDSIAMLADCSLERLNEILENSECAQRLYKFFHSEFTPPPPSEESTEGTSSSSSSSALAPGAKRPRFALAARVKTRTMK
nr:dna repair endonuclease xpf [Hymenolepis microstoma]